MASPWENDAIVSAPTKKPWENDIFAKGPPADAKPGQYGLMWNASGGYDPKTGELVMGGKPMTENADTSKLVSGAAGVADTGMLGFADEAISGLRSMFTGNTYDQELTNTRQGMQKFQNDNPGTYLAGQVGGGVAQGLATGPVTGASRLINPAMTGGKALAARMGVAGAEGLAQGALYGFGSGQDTVGNRVQSAAENAALGGVTGAAAPLVASGVRKGLQSVGIGSAGKSRDEIMKILARSGMSPADVGAELQRAANLGYGNEFIAADALGIPGQNQLASVTRSASPYGDEAQKFLDARMVAAPRRMASAFDEAGGVQGKTARQVAGELKATRSMLGKQEYDAARAASGAVDVSNAIGAADSFLTPGVNNLVSMPPGITDDSIEAALKQAKSRLTDGKSTISDFDSVLRAKVEIQNMVDAAKPGSDKARRLGDIVRSLDDSLATASGPYSQARDTWKSYSKAGEAVDTGANAATRGRYIDTIAAFNSGDDLSKMGQRAGYYDKLAGGVENNPSSVAGSIRELNSPGSARQQEVLAMSGAEGQKLLDRSGIEGKMLDTYQGTKGSRTALNLNEDAAGGVGVGNAVKSLATGNFGNLARQGLDFLVDRATGQTEKSREMVARMLMSQGQQAGQSIQQAIQENVGNKAKADLILKALMVGGALPMYQNNQ